ncbi:BTAD domain-containing putative transcriptional regulator [Streptomyces niveus]|uniref:AfsR/SARP family transcriptional regulator n=1 Tax=Streptomyces niveus TaxID=193462 RepID=UPI00362CC5AB
MNYRYDVLGATRAFTPEGTEVRISGARLRALLTALAAAGGRTVPAERLAAQVWDDDTRKPPADESAALQALVGRLRKALGAAAIASGPGGYRLVVERDDIDLFRFERLAAEGAFALDGDGERAGTLLDEALALWRGPVLADLPGRETDPLVVRARQRHTEARRNRLTAEVRLGRPERALPGLAELAADAPLDEPLQATWIAALRSAGRRAEALQAYDEVRTLLAARLGTDPSRELRLLHARLLSDDEGDAQHSTSPPPGDGAPASERDAVRELAEGSGGSGGARRGVAFSREADASRGGAGSSGGAWGGRDDGAPVAERGAVRDRAVGSGKSDGTRQGVAFSPGAEAPTGRGDRASASERGDVRERAAGPEESGGVRHMPRADAVASPAGTHAAPYTPPSPAPGNLPARLTSFVGREGELLALAEQLRGHRLVTLTGAGGAGKTRLAFEAGASGDWPDGVWVAELASVREPGDVPEAVLTALGGRETAVRGPGGADGAVAGPLDRLVEHCGSRRLLIVLDNCEQVIGAAAALAETVLTRCPHVTVLATSREQLGVRGEFLYAVGPLAPPAALRLLGERGAAARPGFRTDDDTSACEEICRRLDGLPLALELAAARLRLLTPRQLADRLDDRFRLLGAGSGSRTVLPRQQTLRAVVDWSWDLLTESERAVLRRLSVFVGGCAPGEAEEVCVGGDVPVFDALASLVDKSLVVAVPGGPDGMRYRLLETVAEYAAGRLDESGERAAVELRHLRAYRELVRVGEPELRGPRQSHRLAQFEREHDNVRAALRAALHGVDGRPSEQDALCLVLSMSWFWQLRGHQRDARDWSTAATALGPDPFAAPVRPAVPLADPCIDLPPPWSDEQVWEARRGVRLVSFASGEGEKQEAGHAPDDGSRFLADTDTLEPLTRIVAAYGPDMPQVCRQPGVMWFFAGLMTGEWRSMGETLDALVDACRARPGRGWDLGLALTLRGKLLDAAPGNEDRAVRDADEAVALFEQAGDLVILAESLSARGESYERRGRYEEAAADFERAMESCARIGVPTQASLFKARLASVRLEAATGAEADEDAERLLVEAVEESRGQAGRTGGTARLLLAGRYGRTGRTALARDQLTTLEEEPGFREHALQMGLTEGLHGWLDCLDVAYERALDHLRESVRMLDSLAHLVAPQLITSQFLCAAWAKTGTGEAVDGARLLGAYGRHTGLAEKFLFHPYPVGYEREIGRRAEAEVRAALDEETWARAYAEGGALSVREAAALI